MNWLMNAADGAVKTLDKNKGTLLLIGGLVAGFTGTVLACKGTLKAEQIVEEHKHDKLIIETAEDIDDSYKGSDENKKDIAMCYVNTATKMAKAYAPAVIFGGVSVACLVGEHCIMKNKVNNLEKTVASLSAAYIAVDKAFKTYRKRVVDKYGEEEDRKLRYGETTETVKVTDLETGKTKKQTITTVGDLDPSDYAKFFDATSSQFIFQDPMKYKPDWDANIRFLNCTQAYANQKLEIEGYLFLNDVYDMLGIPKTKAGQVVGWIFDPENKSIDSKVSFGIFEPRNHRTINGYEEECILLDFNVDGPIIDKLSLGDM